MNTKYKLYLAKNANTPQGSIVGDFKSLKDDTFICEIILSDSTVKDAGSFSTLSTKFENKYVIYITEDLLSALQDEYEPAVYELYHELGHIHLDHFSQIDGEQENIQEILFQQELDADEFVAEEKGKDFAINAIKTSLSLKGKVDRQMGLNGTPESVKAIRSLRKRIKNLEDKT